MKLHLIFAASGALCGHILWQQPEGSQPAVTESFANEEIDFSKEIPASQKLMSFPSKENSPMAWANSKLPYNGVHAAGHFTWTTADGKDPETMRSLATDAEMFKRLYQQNQYVLRRQFIYVDPAFDKITEEIYKGSRHELKLPGFDGEQLDVVVKNVDLELDDGAAAWNGHLRGNPNAIVQASTIKDDIHIGIHLKDRLVRYETREKNQWIIHEVDLKALEESRPNVEIQPNDETLLGGVLAAH